MSLRVARVVGGIIGLVIALSVVCGFALIRKVPRSPDIAFTVFGIFASVVWSIISVDCREWLKGGNDAGAMRHSTSYLCGAGGGIFLSAFLSLTNKEFTQPASEMIGQGALLGFVMAVMVQILLGIGGFFIELVEHIFRLKITRDERVQDGLEQVVTMAATSISIMALWLFIMYGNWPPK